MANWDEDLEDVWRDILPPKLPRPDTGSLWIEPGAMDAGTISFSVGGTEPREMLRCTADGRIFVRGRLTTTDLEVVDGLRAFLLGVGAVR